MAYEGAIGIDLGTTYSSVAVWENEEVKIIENGQGNHRTPSYVAFTDTERLIGDAAKDQVEMNPTNTVFDVKRLIGRKFSDPVVQSGMKHWPFKVISDAKDNPLVQVQYHGKTKTFRPEQISAMVLVNMKQMAESYLGMDVKKAVISVPTHFTQQQRQATIGAGRIAGLEVLQIIDEPMAAAIAYGLINEKNIKECIDKYGKSHFVLIFDLGGGMFGVSLLTIDDGIFEVWATSGDPHLGGEDFDSRLVAHFIDEFKRRNNGKDMSSDQRALCRLRTACERLKRTLSSVEEATIEIDALFDNIDFRSTITREQFEELCDDLFCRLKQPLEQIMNDWGYSKNYVHEVVLVGGSTRIPKVRQMVSDFFGGKELNKSINPDEAVAYGAAVWGFKLSGGKSKQTEGVQLLLNQSPHTIGIETADGVMEPIIGRNRCWLTENYIRCVCTSSDKLTTASIRVFEGDSKMTKDCHFIGEFKLTDIPPAPCGETEIEFTFDLDANGILNVRAKKKGTNNYYQIDITYDKGRLSKADIERMASDQSQYEEQDKQQRDQKVRDAMKQLENTISSLKDNMYDPSFVAKLDAAATRTINEYIIDTLEWLYKNPMASKDEYKSRNKKLKEVYERIVSESKQRVRDAMKQLENSISSLKNDMDDPVVSMDMEENMKAIINEAIGDACCLVRSNVATVKEYDQKREHLQWLYQLILKGIDQRRVEAKNMVQNYITSIKDKIGDPKVIEQLNERDKGAISQAVEDAEDWLKNNPDVRREEYERYKEGIECTCAPIITLLQLNNNNSEYSDFVMVD